jgi:hypothetical protein
MPLSCGCDLDVIKGCEYLVACAAHRPRVYRGDARLFEDLLGSLRDLRRCAGASQCCAQHPAPTPSTSPDASTAERGVKRARPAPPTDLTRYGVEPNPGPEGGRKRTRRGKRKSRVAANFIGPLQQHQRRRRQRTTGAVARTGPLGSIMPSRRTSLITHPQLNLQGLSIGPMGRRFLNALLDPFHFQPPRLSTYNAVPSTLVGGYARINPNGTAFTSGDSYTIIFCPNVSVTATTASTDPSFITTSQLASANTGNALSTGTLSKYSAVANGTLGAAAHSGRVLAAAIKWAFAFPPGFTSNLPNLQAGLLFDSYSNIMALVPNTLISHPNLEPVEWTGNATKGMLTWRPGDSSDTLFTQQIGSTAASASTGTQPWLIMHFTGMPTVANGPQGSIDFISRWETRGGTAQWADDAVEAAADSVATDSVLDHVWQAISRVPVLNQAVNVISPIYGAASTLAAAIGA